MDYLKRGLLALSRAHRANTMSGHFGAALVATELLLIDHPELPSGVVDALHGELDRLMSGEESWFNPDSAEVTVPGMFEDAPVEGEPVPVAGLAAVLGESMDQLRQSGHNVIFGALTLRGLHQRPELATAELVDGIQQLFQMFCTTGPGRTYLSAEKWVDPRQVPLEDDPEPYTDEADLVRRTLDLVREHATDTRRTLGSQHHIINHAAALVDLRRLGYAELGEQGLPIHRDHIRWWLNSPELSAELGSRKASTADAITAEYWANADLDRGSALLSHRPKTIYGFEILASATGDEKLVAEARQGLKYLF